ncbi:MAG: hypothetical protein ACYS6I_02910, partial [Planctomycetota bacterium]
MSPSRMTAYTSAPKSPVKSAMTVSGAPRVLSAPSLIFKVHAVFLKLNFAHLLIKIYIRFVLLQFQLHVPHVYLTLHCLLGCA